MSATDTRSIYAAAAYLTYSPHHFCTLISSSKLYYNLLSIYKSRPLGVCLYSNWLSKASSLHALIPSEISTRLKGDNEPQLPLLGTYVHTGKHAHMSLYLSIDTSKWLYMCVAMAAVLFPFLGW